MSTKYPNLFADLAAQFHPNQVKTRAGGGGRQLSYITARVAANRLDEVVGPENWRVKHRLEHLAAGTDLVICTLEIKIDDEWIAKEDAGGFKEMVEKNRAGQMVEDEENTVKTAFSDAFKRAASAWGVGRYLYNDGFAIYPEEAPQASPAPSPTGKGSGLGTKQHLELTRKFNEWATKQCETINAKWHQEWESRCDRAMQEGHGAPSKIPDVINPWGFKGHLVKWGVEVCRLDPAIVPEDVKVRQNDALCALIFYRSPEDKAALIAEMGRYLQEQRLRKSEAIYSKHPELAPAGWAEEQDEAEEPDHGDAFEGDIAELQARVASRQTEVG